MQNYMKEWSIAVVYITKKKTKMTKKMKEEDEEEKNCNYLYNNGMYVKRFRTAVFGGFELFCLLMASGHVSAIPTLRVYLGIATMKDIYLQLNMQRKTSETRMLKDVEDDSDKNQRNKCSSYTAKRGMMVSTI